MDTVTPHSLEAERALLGGLLVFPEGFVDVADQISADDFFRDAHRHIYRAMHEMATVGEPIEGVTLVERLKLKGQLEDIGGPAYLFSLTDGVPRSSNLPAYAKIVTDRALKARLIQSAQRILAETADSQAEARDLVDEAERMIFALSQRSSRGDFVDAAALVSEGIKAIDKLLETKKGATGVPTGFLDFDTMTRGFQPGTLVILAARPSMGKTAFALNAAYHAASSGYQVGFFSLEMARQELFIRLVSSVGRIDGHRLQSGYIGQSDFGRMSEAFNEIGISGLHVDDTPTLGLLELRGKARRLKARRGLDVLIVDYLQLMQIGKAENRNLAIADISRSLKLIARELGIPLVALSQLSRETERRAEKRPLLSDLRDSGALEQDADVVVFIHRPEVYQEANDNAGLAEIIIAKQRNGPIGTVRLRWSKESTRFDNWSYA